MELDKLKRQLELKKAEALRAQSALQSKETVCISVHHTLNALYFSRELSPISSDFCFLCVCADFMYLCSRQEIS